MQFEGEPAKLTESCIKIVKDIGTAALNSTQKRGLVGELAAKLAPFVDAARGPAPNDDPTLQMLVDVWNAISGEQASNRSWPDLSANALLMLHLNWAKQWEGKIN
jgi:hypothetical protein